MILISVRPSLSDITSIYASLSNDIHSVPTDKNGNGGNYTGCNTIMTVYKGNKNISSGVIGTASNSNRTFTVSAMSSDIKKVAK